MVGFRMNAKNSESYSFVFGRSATTIVVFFCASVVFLIIGNRCSVNTLEFSLVSKVAADCGDDRRKYEQPSLEIEIPLIVKLLDSCMLISPTGNDMLRMANAEYRKYVYLTRKGRNDKSRFALRNAIESYCNYMKLERKTDVWGHNADTRGMREGMQISSRTLAYTRFLVASIYYRSGRYREAIEHYEKLLKKTENRSLRSNTHLALGEIYFKMMEYKKAREQYGNVLKGVEQRYIYIKGKQLKRFSGGREVEIAIYKTAWCYYKEESDDEALRWFFDFSVATPIREKDDIMSAIREDRARTKEAIERCKKSGRRGVGDE